MTQIPIAAGIAYADLEFLGRQRVIATAILDGPHGLAVVDPGPTTTLPRLRAILASMGASLTDVTDVLLTHIHLDHAGACGTMVREQPRLRVHVHDVGAPHLVDPSRLVSSAGRLYGDLMERLWGEVAPVPVEAVRVLRNGQSLAAGGHHWDVAETPGHASHHVSYFAANAGVAFVGDTAGVQVVPGGFVLPPTPPPDINIASWMRSLDIIQSWKPASLLLTHFGIAPDVDAHLDELRQNLRRFESLADSALARAEDDAARQAWFIEQVREALRARLSDDDLRVYELAGRFDLNWRGLVRHAKTRER